MRQGRAANPVRTAGRATPTVIGSIHRVMDIPSMQPIFETNRLLVCPRTLMDTGACMAMDGDPEVTRFVTGPWSNPVAHRAFIEQRTRGPYPPGQGYWTVRHRGDAGSFIGWVLLIPADTIGPEVEIGWRLRRSAWGRGFATEAARLLIVHAFTTLNLPEVIAEIDPDNAGSLRVAEKLGLRPSGVVQRHGRPALRCTLMAREYETMQHCAHGAGAARETG